MSADAFKGPGAWDRVKVVVSILATILIPLVIALVSQSYTKTLKDNEIGAKYHRLSGKLTQAAHAPVNEIERVRRKLEESQILSNSHLLAGKYNKKQ